MSLTNTENNRLIGIYEKAINNNFSFEDKILIAKKAGYDFIEFSVDESDDKLLRLDWTKKQRNEIKKLLIKHNFILNSMTLSAHRKYSFGSKEKKTLKKAFDIMLKAILLAKDLGIRTIQLAGYDVYYEESDAQTKLNFLNNFKKVALMASKYSVMLAFEIMDTPFMGTICRALKYVNNIDSPFIKIYPDLGNLYQWSNNIENELTIGKNQIVGFHFKDTEPGVFRDVPFGFGTVDFVKILKVIKNLKLNVPVLIEMWSKNEKNETIENAVNYISNAKSFYEEQWKKVGGDN